MDMDFFEARVYGAVIDLLHDVSKSGVNVIFTDLDHYKIMLLVHGGVELRDFEHAINHRPRADLDFTDIANWALNVAALRKQKEGE